MASCSAKMGGKQFSLVWQNFEVINGESEKAKCKLCQKALLCRGGSTSGLLRHLRRFHQGVLPAETILVHPEIESILDHQQIKIEPEDTLSFTSSMCKCPIYPIQ